MPHGAYGSLVPWAGVEPAPPAVEAHSLNHWTIRKVPSRCCYGGVSILSVFVVVQSLSCVQRFVTPWTLSSPVSQSLLIFMSTEAVILSNHLILCHPCLLLLSIFHHQHLLCCFHRVLNYHTHVLSKVNQRLYNAWDWECVLRVKPNHCVSFRSLLFSSCFLRVLPSAMLTGKLKLAIFPGTSMMEKTRRPPTEDS